MPPTPENKDILTAIGISVSLATFIYTQWRNRKINEINFAFKLMDKFDSKILTHHRLTAADVFLRKGFDNLQNEEWEKIDPILDFFQEIAVFTKNGHLTPKLIWNLFFYWIGTYYYVSTKHIEETNNEYPGCWDDLIWLHKKLKRIDKKINNGKYSSHDTESIQVFFHAESTRPTI